MKMAEQRSAKWKYLPRITKDNSKHCNNCIQEKCVMFTEEFHTHQEEGTKMDLEGSREREQNGSN